MCTHAGFSDSGQRQAAAAAPQDSLLVRAWWLSWIVIIHAMWGLYPVVARWLQTQPAETLPALRLTFYINAFACVTLATFVSLPRALLRRQRGAGSALTSDETKPIMAGNGDSVRMQLAQVRSNCWSCRSCLTVSYLPQAVTAA